MKSYIKKKLIKHIDIICLLFVLYSGFWTNFYKPSSFYPQEMGVLDRISIQSNFFRFRKYRTIYEVYVFHFGIKELSIMKVKGENYDHLIGKQLLYRYNIYSNLMEIINNGETIFSIDEDKPKFYKWLAVFCLSLTSCIWLFVLRVKNSNTQTQNQPPGMEEYFFDDWSIACKNGKFSLTYISKRDYLLYTIEITENEFLLAKQKKILFDYFSSNYQLY